MFGFQAGIGWVGNLGSRQIKGPCLGCKFKFWFGFQDEISILTQPFYRKYWVYFFQTLSMVGLKGALFSSSNKNEFDLLLWIFAMKFSADAVIMLACHLKSQSFYILLLELCWQRYLPVNDPIYLDIGMWLIDFPYITVPNLKYLLYNLERPEEEEFSQMFNK